MKIKRMKLKNFRRNKKETLIKFDDLTAFIGKNDVGKSTILEALDIFFNDGSGAVKIETNDLSVPVTKENNNAVEDQLPNFDKEIVITVLFSDYEEIIIDEKHKTTLDKEYMLNSNGLLEIEKRYQVSDSHRIGKSSIFIRAKHPTNPDCAGLLLKKNSELRKIIKSK